MRQLNTNEITNVSGATLYLGDGVYFEVSSCGIPPQYFAQIESYLQTQINNDIAFQSTMASWYLDQYYANMDHGTMVICC